MCLLFFLFFLFLFNISLETLLYVKGHGSDINECIVQETFC